MTKARLFWIHFTALATVAIWGTTFVSTKVLIINGLTPTDIFFYRFLLAYLCIWFVAPKRLFSASIKDEFWFLVMGFCGGALYFIAENTALELTLVSNVSLIVCIAPLLTALLMPFFYQNEKPHKMLFVGSVMALVGVALVVFNGTFILKLAPKGDILTIIAALSWAFYCLILKRLSLSYPILFITRKVFFYGMVTLVPFMPFFPLHFNLTLFTKIPVILNLFFLAIVASLLCFITWNIVVKELGAIPATNYIYIVPLVAMITSTVLLDEPINFVMVIGCALILMGVFIGQRNQIKNSD